MSNKISKIDEKLKETIESADDQQLVEAIITFGTDAHEPSVADAIAHSIVDHAAQRTGVKPQALYILPRIGVMHIRARTILLHQLLEDERVSAGTVP